MKNIVEIQSLYLNEYDIIVYRDDTDDDNDDAVVARCWDASLAEKIRETVEKYMEENAAS